MIYQIQNPCTKVLPVLYNKEVLGQSNFLFKGVPARGGGGGGGLGVLKGAFGERLLYASVSDRRYGVKEELTPSYCMQSQKKLLLISPLEKTHDH